MCYLTDSLVAKTRTILFAATAAVLLVGAGCQGSGGEAAPRPQQAPEPADPDRAGITDTEILIGQWSPQTGAASSWGAVARGTKAYFDYINSKGGIHGRNLTLLIRDDGYQPSRTVAAVKEMAETDDVFGFVVGVGTATGMAVKCYLEDNNIPWVGAGSGSLKFIEPMHPCRFAVFPTYAREGRLLVKYIAETLKLTKIGVFYQNDAFGAEGLLGTKQGIEEYGGELVAEASYESMDNDVSGQALRMKQAGAEAVVLWPTAKHAADFVKECRKIRYAPQVLASSTVSDPILFKLAGDAWEGVITASWTPMITDDEGALSEYREAMARFAPGEPIGNFSLAGFILAEPMVEGLRRVGRDLSRSKFVEAMESIKNWNGVYAHDVTYGPDDREGTTSIYFLKAENGRLVRASDWLN